LLFLGAHRLAVGRARSYLLPTLALALPLAAMSSGCSRRRRPKPCVDMRLPRGGVPSGRLIWLHAGRQARPVLGVAGIVAATLFSGSVAVE
jgi:ABC-type dipeptide/oligopeptide/nickel transport system permease component